MSHAGPSARGYGITKADVEASRLVFVSLRNSVPKRKVAVPVPDRYSWEEFVEQVKVKLRLEAVGSVYFASTGERISSLDGLEDIDELYVEEAMAGLPESSGGHSSYLRNDASTSEIQIAPSPSTRLHRQASVMDAKPNHSVPIGNGETMEEEGAKYIKRSTLLKRMAQRIFPEAFTPGLPVTSKSSGNEDRSVKKRRRHRAADGKMLLLLFAVLGSFVTMTMLYVRSSNV